MDFTEKRFYQWAGVPVDEIVRRLAAEKGLTVDAKAIADERDHYFHSLPPSKLHPVTPVVDIARRFQQQLPMAVATGSAQASAQASLQAIGILDRFDAVVSSHEVGRPKPAPDVFLLAAERIGVAPEDCVAFEDGDTGLLAAREARMHAIDIRPWIQRGGCPSVKNFSDTIGKPDIEILYHDF